MTETWLSDSVYDSEFVPSGYSAFRNDRGSKGGGVCVIFKDNLKISRMVDIPGVEGIFCKTYHKNVRYIIGGVYRPPNAAIDVLNELQNYLNLTVKHDDRIILTGDFNLPNIDWKGFSLKQGDLSGEVMLDICYRFDLLQLVEDYTRTQGTSRSILDLFLVNEAITPQASTEVVPGISDHHAVLLTLSDTAFDKQLLFSSFPNFERADDAAIIDLLSFNFDSFSNKETDIQNLWDWFKDIVNECIASFVPLITKKPKRKNPWISRATLRLRRQIKRLKKKRKLNTAHSEHILDLSQKLKNQIQTDKQRYYGESLPNYLTSSPEKFWRSISPVSRQCDVFDVDGILTDDNVKIANCF